jgi:hypothetical protein
MVNQRLCCNGFLSGRDKSFPAHFDVALSVGRQSDSSLGSEPSDQGNNPPLKRSAIWGFPGYPQHFPGKHSETKRPAFPSSPVLNRHQGTQPTNDGRRKVSPPLRRVPGTPGSNRPNSSAAANPAGIRASKPRSNNTPLSIGSRFFKKSIAT